MSSFEQPFGFAQGSAGLFIYSKCVARTFRRDHTYFANKEKSPTIQFGCVGRGCLLKERLSPFGRVKFSNPVIQGSTGASAAPYHFGNGLAQVVAEGKCSSQLFLCVLE